MRFHTNTTGAIQHIGNVTVMPGETRQVEDYAPAARPDSAAESISVDDLIIEIQMLSARKAIARLGELDASQLEWLKELENGQDTPRTTLIEAIDAAALALAAST